MEAGRCNECKCWIPTDVVGINFDVGTCKAEEVKLYNMEQDQFFGQNGISTLVGCNFGCIHFEEG